MRAFLFLVIVVFATCAPRVQATASIQAELLCWEPDFELPVPCDDDDD